MDEHEMIWEKTTSVRIRRGINQAGCPVELDDESLDLNGRHQVKSSRNTNKNSSSRSCRCSCWCSCTSSGEHQGLLLWWSSSYNGSCMSEVIREDNDDDLHQASSPIWRLPKLANWNVKTNRWMFSSNRFSWINSKLSRWKRTLVDVNMQIQKDSKHSNCQIKGNPCPKRKQTKSLHFSQLQGSDLCRWKNETLSTILRFFFSTSKEWFYFRSTMKWNPHKIWEEKS